MRQLNGVDVSFLSWEGPTTVGHVTSVLLLDPSTSPEPWTFERFRRHLQSRLDRLEPLTRKLVEIPLGLDRPYWTPDPHFDLDYHLRYVAVPGGGSRDHFADLVARIHERPLDRRRPLWECYVVDGVDEDRKAIISKIHHAAIDGLSGQELLAVLVDLDPTTHVPEEPVFPDSEQTDPEAEPVEMGDLLAKAAVSLARSPARLVRAGMTVGRALPVLGAALGRHSPNARGDETTRELLRRFGGAPRTPFNASIGPHRRWSFVSVPLDDVKAIKRAAGATVNDVLLTIVGGVLRSWLQDRQELPDRPLAAMVPLSVRQPDDVNAIGNYLSTTVTTLATHVEDPADRLAAVVAGMETAKAHHEALPAEILTDITQIAPPAVAALAARLVASTKLADRVTLPFNLVVSNVPGPPVPIYLAGALIVGHFPVSAIVDGVGLNVTIMSINGDLDFGFVSDRELIDDLWALADRVPDSVIELAEAVGADFSIG